MKKFDISKKLQVRGFAVSLAIFGLGVLQNFISDKQRELTIKSEIAEQLAELANGLNTEEES